MAELGPMYERAATDGELEEEGVEQLLELLQLTESSVFADLGSGRGEALLHIAARVEVQRAIGIELLPARHQRACELRDTCEEQELLKTPVILTEGDLTELGGEALPAKSSRQDAIHCDLDPLSYACACHALNRLGSWRYGRGARRHRRRDPCIHLLRVLR